MTKNKGMDAVLTRLHAKSRCKRLCVRIFSKGTKMLKLLFLRRGEYGSQDRQFDPSIDQKVTNSPVRNLLGPKVTRP